MLRKFSIKSQAVDLRRAVLRARVCMRKKATCFLVAEYDVKLSLNLFTTVTCEATIRKHLQRVTRRMSLSLTTTTSITLASSPLRACSSRIFLPNSSTRPIMDALSAAEMAYVGDDPDAEVSM